jgi:hypothetical protein
MELQTSMVPRDGTLNKHDTQRWNFWVLIIFLTCEMDIELFLRALPFKHA